MKEDSWEDTFLTGNLEKSKEFLNNNQVDLRKALICVIKMKSRNYKLYKQIVLSKMIVANYKATAPRYFELDRSMLDVLKLAINANSTFIAKLLLREGVNIQLTVDMRISNNMQKLLFSFGYGEQLNQYYKLKADIFEKEKCKYGRK